MPQTPEQMFNKPIAKQSKKGGLYWFLYYKKVLHNRIYLFIKQIQAEIGQQIQLYETNIANYTKAAKLNIKEANQHGIQ